MSVDRVKFQDIVESQLPRYVREEFPLLPEFLKQYYLSQEVQSGTLDIVQNIDQYVKLDKIFNLSNETELFVDVDYTDTTINTGVNGNFTVGFPDINGLIQIDDEIIFYESRTEKTFEGCVRGFSGITSYISPGNPEELVFNETSISTHKKGAKVKNLSVIFLQEFFKKIKFQFAPGFAGRSLDSSVDQRNFVTSVNSFYASKGTDESFKILFRALYGEEANIINPQRFLFKPSDAYYHVTQDMIVEAIDGDPLELFNQTLFQESTGANGTVNKIEKINSQEGDFYQVGIDIGYDRDINVRGSIFGKFDSDPKTKILNNISVGQTFVDVDSTLGFGQTGYLVASNIDGDPITLNYVGKSINQFYNVEGVTSLISEGTNIRTDQCAYAYVGFGSANMVKVRIGASLKEFTQEDETYLSEEGDLIRIKSLGIESDSESSQGWFTNLKTTLDVSTITEIDTSERIYEVNTFDNHFLYSGYRVVLYNDKGVSVSGELTRITSRSSFILKLESEIVTSSLGVDWKVTNQVLKTETQKYPYLSDINTNVLNTYSNFDGDTLVVSNSIPSYQNQSIDPNNKSIVFNGSAIDTFILKLTTNSDHGFKTGDAVRYNRGVIDITTTTPDGIVLITQEYSGFDGLDELIYYVKRIDQEKIKLSRSRSDIFAEKFVPLSGEVEDVKFIYYPNYNKSLIPQPIVRKILPVDLESGDYITEPADYNGILLNGVELVNYKSTDKIFYGQVEGINIGNPGIDYDVINPPLIHIEDTDVVGSGATGIVAVEGNLLELRILDNGFDYLNTPVVSITGGDGVDASAEVNMTEVYHSVSFNAGINTTTPLTTLTGSISTETNSIGFTTFHKFRDNERVFYKAKNQQVVGGLVAESEYYVSVVNPYEIKLHNTFDEAEAGTNVIGISSVGYGIQEIESYDKKNIVTSIVVTNPGSGYKNKQRQIPELVGVQTSTDEITIINHGYDTGSIVNYYSTGNDIVGLSTNQDYFVTKTDENNFKLSLVGSGVTDRNFYIERNLFVDIESTGVGYFNYKPIVVTVDGIIGVNSVTDGDFTCKVQPIFRGPLDSVDITEGGVGYGSSEILNFNRTPVVRFKSGENCKVKPIISNGRIVDVVIVEEGSEYFSTPSLVIDGSGQFARLIPITNNDGRLVDVVIENPGIGYVADETTIFVVPAGRNVISEAVINQWNIDIVRRDRDIIGSDDGFVTQSNDNQSLQYSSPYIPRSLRKNVNALNGDGTRFFGANDLEIEDGVEVDSIRHSPIVGWAYDGSPIYGPYGFANSKKGLIKQMVSGYEMNIDNPNRPSKSIYPGGFFIEDYVFTNKGDLDKHNGRFCVTPDYPNGVYAYFTTVSIIPDSFGPFKNFKSPSYPYTVGPTFKYKPNGFNLKSSSNTNEYDIESSGWFRNTDGYHLNDDRSGYDYIFDSRTENEDLIEVTSTSSGSIQNIGITTGGIDYKVNDRLVFNNTNTKGRDAQVKVERVLGKTVNNINTVVNVIENVEFVTYNSPQQFIGFSTLPNNLTLNEVVNIDGLSQYYKGFDGAYNVGVRSDNFVLSLGIQTTGITGITTYFYIAGALQYPYIRPNDVLSIGTEIVKVLNIEPTSERIRVQRAQNGTVGVAHTNRSILREDPKKFTINVGSISTDRQSRVNTELYFIPTESVGIGTTTGLGVGTTVSLNDPGVGKTTRFLEPQSIFIPGHKLKLNDRVIYNNHGNNSIQVWNGVGNTPLEEYDTLFVAPLSIDTIGIATNRIGVSSEGFVGINSDPGLISFTSAGNGEFQSFETNFNDIIRAQVNKSTVTVSTAKTHSLEKNDVIYLSVKPYDFKTVIVKYNDFNRRFVFDPVSWNTSDVDTSRDLITVTDHEFNSGDKVIYNTNGSDTGGFEDQGMYYVVPYDTNRIRFVKNKYEVNLLSPTFVDITSQGQGTISKVNPLVTVKRNQKLKFDLSDSSLSFQSNGNSYSGFEMNLFEDLNYVNEYVTSEQTEEFEVTKIGRAGIDSDANLTLVVSDFVPQNLWYDFEKLNLDILKDSKRGYELDSEPVSHNQIFVTNTKYDGIHTLIGVGDTTFTFNIAANIDVVSYDQDNAIISYETTSKTEKGRITKFNIINPGQDYKSLPSISSVRSESGTGAILYAESTNVGNILNTKYVSGKIAYDMPTDKTLKVVSNVPQILDVFTLASLDHIGISSNGRNYLIAPDLILLDGFTNEVVPEIDIQYTIGDPEVTILTNTYNLYPTTPRIVPVNNSNGIGISFVSYTESDKTANIVLDKTFGSIDLFPFGVGDEVFIENTSVGINSTKPGYNSADYSYSYFRIVSIDPNIGGSGGSVTIDMSDALSPGVSPGTYDQTNSFGNIVKAQDFPIFNIEISKNNFFVGEKVVSENATGFIESWNPITEVARVSSPNTFKVDDKLVAQTSGTVSFIDNVITFDSQISTGAGTTIINGWQRETGFLNNNLQVTPNNDYYQNFSYSIASRVPLETWEDAVSATNHPVGFKKFSDLQVESFVEDSRYNRFGINSDTEVTVDIVSSDSIHCFHDFDSVSERTVDIKGTPVSKEIHFENKILTDHFESIGNLVTIVDDISGKFNSITREDEFIDIGNFDVSQVFNRVYTLVKDDTFTQQRQFGIYSILQDGVNGYISEYGSLTSAQRLGEFDYIKKQSGWQLRFFPSSPKFNSYDVTVCTAGLFSESQGIGTDRIGDVGAPLSLAIGQTKLVPAGSQENIVSFSSTMRSAKVRTLFVLGDDEYEAAEINMIHDGTDVHFSKYGDMGSTVDVIYGNSGIGTYDADFDGSNIVLKFTNNTGTGVTAVSSVVLTSANETGVSSTKMRTSTLLSSYIDIPATGTPTSHGVGVYDDPFSSAVYYVTVSNTTDGTHSFHEITTLNTDFEEVFGSFGEIETGNPIGTFGITNDTSNTILTFTPIPNKDVEVRVLAQELLIWDGRDFPTDINTDLFNYTNNEASYKGTELEQTNVFKMESNGVGIFERDFDGSNPEIVGVGTNTITIPNHLFESGQNITYDGNQGRENNTTFNNISIAATVVSGIGLTDKLPNDCFAVKVSNKQIAFAASASDALAVTPKTFELTGVGIGTFHRVASKNEDERTLILIDNMIQSPIANTNIETQLATSLQTESDLRVTGITSFFPSDIIRIDDEFMTIISAYQDPDDNLYYMKVVRGSLDSTLNTHTNGSTITKITGNYHITRENKINFVESPKGKNPLSTTTAGPDNVDWTGITTNSSFQGRVFNRTSFVGETDENYVENVIFDDISSAFTGITSEFVLKNLGVNQTGISTDNIITLINGVFQDPNGVQRDGRDENPSYDLSEVSGETIIQYQANPYNGENNTQSYPRGGILMEVGSSPGLGYQPLVSAGGTATVSATGTITSISIGNSGSGYRPGAQPVVNVGVQTYSNGVPSIEFIGTAAISGGSIVSVAVTNPGSGYTSTSAPKVIFDEPLSYDNIPLVYASGSSGIGTGGTIDIIVGQGSSVIDFTLRDTGSGYGDNIKLTVGVGGTVGIPTFSNHSDFELDVVRTQRDSFNGWYIGEFEVLDRLDKQFDGYTKTFNLSVDGEGLAIHARKGSRVDAKKNLLVFINNVLQEPDRSYDMQGGSVIRFTEAPKVGDTGALYFYKGTRDKDVVFQDILETVQPGDTLNIDNDPALLQSQGLDQNDRIVVGVSTLDVVTTSPYINPGVTTDTTLLRPVSWCKQLTDVIIDGEYVGKDRMEYEPNIFPFAYLTQSVGVVTTIVYIDSVKPLFDSLNETEDERYQEKIQIISQDPVEAASATANVNQFGQVDSITITNPGVGYTAVPNVSISIPETGQRAFAEAINKRDRVDKIDVVQLGSGYDPENPPIIDIAPPNYPIEIVDCNSFTGDYGIIVGLGTGTTGNLETQLIFDFFIPYDSFMRNDQLTQDPKVTSGINTGDFFTVFNSKTIFAQGSVVSLENDNVTRIGLSTDSFDNIYQVESVETRSENVPGVGTTDIRRVFTNIIGSPVGGVAFDNSTITFDSTSHTMDNLNYQVYSGGTEQSFTFGEFSWGKVDIKARPKAKPFNANTGNGYAGLSTSTYVRRFNQLKFKNYDIIDY